jgi:iron complex transport system ATP-binding protein
MNLSLKRGGSDSELTRHGQGEAFGLPESGQMTVELQDVAFSYHGTDNPVISGINLTLDHPGLYCIVGPNGVGKSTLIKCINKLNKPTAGRVLINGWDTRELSLKDVAKYIGYVPVTTFDVFSMPVIDAILLGAKSESKWKTTDSDLEMATRGMKMLGIEDLAMRGFNQLSAGQHQKVAICRGLIQKPKMLILDEPTANLDVKHQVYVTELLRGLAETSGMIVLMISHDLNVAAKYAHQIIVMSPPGVITKVGPPEEIITEELISELYDIECKVTLDEGRPHVVLGSAKSI